MFRDVFISQWCTVSQHKATQQTHALKHVFPQVTRAGTPNPPLQPTGGVGLSSLPASL